MTYDKEIKEEEEFTLKIGDFIFNIKHNDIGVSIDVFGTESEVNNVEVLEEIVVYFDDLKTY